jgi:hypothetical protein
MKTETTPLKEGKVVKSLWSAALITRRLNIPTQISIQLHEALHEGVMKLHEVATAGIAS